MRIGRHLTRLALPAAALAVAAPAWAQDAEGEGDIIVTAQRNNETQVGREGSVGVLGNKPAEDVPFSIKSYNEALILNQQPQTLGQVLENDPSIRTTYGFGNAAEQFVIRGFPLFGDDIGFDGLYGITPRQLIAPELYENVQVLNGASAFLNGAAPGGSSIGGSVNLIPKRAKRDPLQRVTLNYTSDAHFGGSFDVSRRFGDFGVRVNGAFRSGDVSVDDEFRRTFVVGGALDYDAGPLRVSLDLAYQSSTVRGLRHKVKVGSAVPAVPAADHNFAQPWTYTKLRDVFGVAKVEYDLSDNAMLYASFGARDGSEEGLYGGITVNNVLTGASTYDAAYIPRTDNNEAATAGFRVKLGSAITQEINIGASMLWAVNRNAYEFYLPSATPDTNLYTNVVLPVPTTIWFAGGNLTDPYPISRSRLSSVFASDTFGFWDDRVLVTAGLRLQGIRVKSYSYFGGGFTGEYDEDAVTPVFGVVVKPVRGLSIFANRIQGLSQGPTAPLDATLVNAGEVFAPYKSTQYEVGAKLGLGRFNASVALFQTDLPSAYAIPDPQGSGLLRYGVYGEQRNRGLELSVDGEPTKGLRVIAGLSINDAKLRVQAGGVNEGNKAPGVPDYLANANVEWDLPFLRALTLTGRVVHTGPQQVNIGNTLEIPDWTRFDMGVRYVAVVADKPLTLRFNVDNVANKRYWASSFDAFAPQLLQGMPRTFKLSASIDL